MDRHMADTACPKEGKQSYRISHLLQNIPHIFFLFIILFYWQRNAEDKQRNQLHSAPYLIEEILYKVCYSHII